MDDGRYDDSIVEHSVELNNPLEPFLRKCFCNGRPDRNQRKSNQTSDDGEQFHVYLIFHDIGRIEKVGNEKFVRCRNDHVKNLENEKQESESQYLPCMYFGKERKRREITF